MRLSLKESRMKFTSATKFNRKSGGAQWRDLRFLFGAHDPLADPWVITAAILGRVSQELGLWT
jgi:hypothetical protein